MGMAVAVPQECLDLLVAHISIACCGTQLVENKCDDGPRLTSDDADENN
jgi:hypothetical protein